MELCKASYLIYLNFVLGSVTGLKKKFVDAFLSLLDITFDMDDKARLIMWSMPFFADSGNQDFGKLLSARSQGREKTRETRKLQDFLHRATYLHFCILLLTLLRARCHCQHVSYAMQSQVCALGKPICGRYKFYLLLASRD